MEGNSIMWKYIKEESSILLNLLLSEDIQTAVNGMNQKKTEAIYFVCHGSSYNAATVISNFLAKYAGVRVYCYTPGNFLKNCESISFEDRETTLVAAISQTGTSRGTLEAVKKAKDLGFQIVGITEYKESPLYKESDVSLHLNCGPEDSNAKTKGYSATLLVLLSFATYLGLRKGTISQDTANDVLNELHTSVEGFPPLFNQTLQWCRDTNFGKDMKNLFVLGNEMNFGTALEGQLKIMETMCIPTVFNDIEEFSHGMHRAINNDSSVIILNSNESGKELMVKTFDYLKTKTSKVMMINTSEQEINDPMAVNIKNMPLTQSVLSITLVIQILSAFIPELNGHDPNKDANNDYTVYMKTRVS